MNMNNGKMKILMAADTFLPLMGGGEIHVAKLCENLTKLGHEVTLITNETRECEQLAYKVIRVPWRRGSHLRLLKLIWDNAKGADIVHAHYSYRLAALSSIPAWIRGRKLVVTLHGLGTLPEAKAKFPYTLIHYLYRLISLNFADRIISTSEDLAKVARRYLINKKKIKIIFNGVDTGKFSPDIRVPDELLELYKDKKIILTARRLVPKNGVHFLIESLPNIISRIPEALLIIIGKGRLEHYIKNRINELNLGNNVVMLGELANELVPQYMKLSDVIVFPSTAESSSIACAEAMSTGKVVVASAVGGLIELIGEKEERGYLVKLVEWTGSDYDAPLSLSSDKYDSLAGTVMKAIKSDNHIKTLAAMKFAVEQLDWGVVTEETIDIYRNQ